MTARRPVIAVAGALAQRPGIGGHAWVLLQYLLGFRRLGWEVLLLDRIDPADCVDRTGRPCPPDRSAGVHYLREVMHRYGLEDSWVVLVGDGATVGPSREDVLDRLRDCPLLVDVNGYLGDEELLGRAGLSVYLDIDPGFAQMWQDLGLHSSFADHDAYVTVGLNIGTPSCDIPTCGVPWITTPPPVVLEHWPDRSTAGGEHFTSVCSWRGSLRTVEFRGRTYGLRAHEFRTFAGIPRATGRTFRLALRIDPSERADLDLLREGGWSLVDPRAVAGTPWNYRSYIQRAKAEFQVAKTMYVQTRSGWVSDRSLAFLASGKPVVAQDTGLGEHYPVGKGLLVFSTVDQAVDAVEEVSRNYGRHARASRALAEQHFDSDKVLGRLLQELEVDRGPVPVGRR